LAHPLRYRPTGTSLVPYLEFPLGLVPLAQGPNGPQAPVLPVNDVMLGPGASQEAANAVQAFLDSKSIKIVPRRSDVPYRQAYR
jgi:hypothetical protein